MQGTIQGRDIALAAIIDAACDRSAVATEKHCQLVRSINLSVPCARRQIRNSAFPLVAITIPPQEWWKSAVYNMRLSMARSNHSTIAAKKHSVPLASNDLRIMDPLFQFRNFALA